MPMNRRDLIADESGSGSDDVLVEQPRATGVAWRRVAAVTAVVGGVLLLQVAAGGTRLQPAEVAAADAERKFDFSSFTKQMSAAMEGMGASSHNASKMLEQLSQEAKSFEGDSKQNISDRTASKFLDHLAQGAEGIENAFDAKSGTCGFSGCGTKCCASIACCPEKSYTCCGAMCCRDGCDSSGISCKEGAQGLADTVAGTAKSKLDAMIDERFDGDSKKDMKDALAAAMDQFGVAMSHMAEHVNSSEVRSATNASAAQRPGGAADLVAQNLESAMALAMQHLKSANSTATQSTDSATGTAAQQVAAAAGLASQRLDGAKGPSDERLDSTVAQAAQSLETAASSLFGSMNRQGFCGAVPCASGTCCGAVCCDKDVGCDDAGLSCKIVMPTLPPVAA
mmetsp:Transcript_53854/g.155488  ORF Transcript_53854/g.155488 Transcript_53854/m.155488 type:complete len:396 (-) Transcript_53854:263-1450(-)